jgi:hypothetical protein
MLYHFTFTEPDDRQSTSSCECRSEKEAWSFAVQACGEMLLERAGEFEPGQSYYLRVSDADGQLCWEASFETVGKPVAG